jgi:hypothetical protein
MSARAFIARAAPLAACRNVRPVGDASAAFVQRRVTCHLVPGNDEGGSPALDHKKSARKKRERFPRVCPNSPAHSPNTRPPYSSRISSAIPSRLELFLRGNGNIRPIMGEHLLLDRWNLFGSHRKLGRRSARAQQAWVILTGHARDHRTIWYSHLGVWAVPVVLRLCLARSPALYLRPLCSLRERTRSGRNSCWRKSHV